MRARTPGGSARVRQGHTPARARAPRAPPCSVRGRRSARPRGARARPAGRRRPPRVHGPAVRARAPGRTLAILVGGAAVPEVQVPHHVAASIEHPDLVVRGHRQHPERGRHRHDAQRRCARPPGLGQRRERPGLAAAYVTFTIAGASNRSVRFCDVGEVGASPRSSSPRFGRPCQTVPLWSVGCLLAMFWLVAIV
jgi:hypothetical protein